MNEEAVTEKLATALRDKASAANATPCDMTCGPEDCPSCDQPVQAFSFINGRPESVFGTADDLAAALLPVVREIAAQELREAASALGAMPAQGVHVPTVGLVMGHIRDRADALTKPPDGPVR